MFFLPNLVQEILFDQGMPDSNMVRRNFYGENLIYSSFVQGIYIIANLTLNSVLNITVINPIRNINVHVDT